HPTAYRGASRNATFRRDIRCLWQCPRSLTRGGAISMVRAALRAAVRKNPTKSRVRSMSDGTRSQGTPPDDEAALSARLQRLGDRLAQADRPTEHEAGSRQTANHAAGFARGFRLCSELVAGVL